MNMIKSIAAAAARFIAPPPDLFDRHIFVGGKTEEGNLTHELAMAVCGRPQRVGTGNQKRGRVYNVPDMALRLCKPEVSRQQRRQHKRLLNKAEASAYQGGR